MKVITSFAIVVVLVVGAFFYFSNAQEKSEPTGDSAPSVDERTIGTNIPAKTEGDTKSSSNKLIPMKSRADRYETYDWELAANIDQDMKKNLDLVQQHCGFFRGAVTHDCRTILEEYFMGSNAVYAKVRVEAFVDPYADFDTTSEIIQWDECNLMEGPIHLDRADHCQLDTLLNTLSFLSNCPAGPLHSDVEPLDRERIEYWLENYPEDAYGSMDLHLNNSHREEFYREAWLRLKCEEIGNWFGVLLPGIKVDTSQMFQQIEPQELQNQLDEFDSAWWDLNRLNQRGNRERLSAILARLGDRWAVWTHRLDSKVDSKYFASVRQHFPSKYHWSQCHDIRYTASHPDDSDRHCFYGHYGSYVNDLSEFSMTRYRYAKRTRDLNQEQVDRYISEYDGVFDMQFVNGPMQQDQENTAGDNVLEDSY